MKKQTKIQKRKYNKSSKSKIYLDNSLTGFVIEHGTLPKRSRNGAYSTEAKAFISNMVVDDFITYPKEKHGTISNIISQEHKVYGGKAFTTYKTSNTHRAVHRIV